MGAPPSLAAARAHRARIVDLARKRGAANIRIFGSVARGDADQASDLDILVDLDPGRSLLDLGALQVELEAEFQCRVDLITTAGLRPRLRERVLREAVPL